VRLRGAPIVFTAFLMVLGGSYPGRLAGQYPSAVPASSPRAELTTPRFGVDSTLVLIPTTVTDPLNRFVLGLHKEDFHVFEDGAEQTITHFSGEDAPLSAGLVFDASGSMADKLGLSIEAVRQFLKTMNPQDEAFLVRFSDRAELLAGFTSQAGDIEEKLTGIRPGGLTALLDATELALEEMKKAKNPHKAIVIISDGGDNHSKYSPADIQSLVREADVQIYAMGVFEPSFLPGFMTKEEISGPRLLSGLAQQTGGRAFSATLPSDLPGMAARIGIELRNQYVLAYSPKNTAKDGKYRHIEVKLDQPAGLATLKVRSRVGYYARTE
jgi:Ca-activated chloride channel family protein